MNIRPDQYHNKGKIWDIHSDNYGIIYMAADKGLLEYDGKTWNSYRGSAGFTRSLLVVNDSMIYTGSDLDFGIWKKNRYQTFEYQSLYPFKKEVNSMYEEFWDIHKFNDNIIFVSFQNIYVYKNQQLTKIAAPDRISGSFMVDGSLYFALEKTGIYRLSGFSLEPVCLYPENSFLEVTGLYREEKGLVIVSKSQGLYLFTDGKLIPLKNELSEKLKISKVFCFEQPDARYLAFGTILNGLYISTLDGKIIHHINKNKGLINSTVLSLHYQPSGKLWMGMDYGISVVNLLDPFTYIYDYSGNFGTGYTALINQGTFYLGTNQGLYKTEWSNLSNNRDIYRFDLIPGSEGQVWSLANIGNTLFIGHDLGLYTLSGNTVSRINDQHGFWTIIPYKEYILTGNYNGITVFRKTGNSWTFLKNMELIYGSCNQLVVEKDNILWINIPNFGIIRAVLDSNLYPAERMIFPDSLFKGDDPYITFTENCIHVSTDKSHYEYDPIQQKFLLDKAWLGHTVIEGKLSGLFQQMKLNDDYSFFPVYNGFALKSLNEVYPSESSGLFPVFRRILVYNNHEKTQWLPEERIPYRMNNVEAAFMIPNREQVLYQYQLNDTSHWMAWTPDNTIRFLNLKEGRYTLFVKASINGYPTRISEISFRIAAPWYRSVYAWIFYIIALAMTVYLVLYLQKLSLKKQKKAMLLREQNSLRQQAEKFNRERMQLEQERLELEVNQIKEKLKNKTIELANKAKDNEDKNRILLALKEKCDEVEKKPHLFKTRWNEMQHLLQSCLNDEDKTFEIQMDELHQEFFKKLKDNFPGLSGNDLRLCAYLKIGLNSKEIADILNIQPSSSYISRSRLRKKLDLKPDEDLYDFLNKL